VAEVVPSGSSTLQLILGPEMLSLSTGGVSFATVDFNNAFVLDCNWDTLTCTLDPDQVGFCTPTSGAIALGGCS
jgi:hypothetical protein